MKNKIIGRLVIAVLSLIAQPMMAQEAAAPNWVNKVQKAIISVSTYDKDNNLLKSGTGFYVSNDGIAIADYGLFEGAYSAVVVDMSGQKSNVEQILGADDTYALVRFKVNVKKNISLTQSTVNPSEDAMVFALKYDKNKIVSCPTARVREVKPVGDVYTFMTLSYAMDESYLGAPLFNSNGELIGTIQPSMGSNGYALGIKFIESLKIQAIASKAKTLALDNIHIAKGLPDNMEESLVYLYMKSRTYGNEEYLNLLNQFVATYPDNAEGYFRRATPLIDLHRFEDADKDLQTYYKLEKDKAEANSKIADIIYTKLIYQPTPAYDKWTYDVAIDYIDKALKEKSDNLEYKLLKSQILMSKKDFDGALAIYDEINKSDQRSSATLYAASLAHEGRGDTATVQIELLDSAIALFSTPLPAEAASYVLRRGQLYAQIGKYREAVTDYNQYSYLSNSKVNSSFYYDRSQLELQAKMYQQALDDLNSAITLSPNVALLYVEKSGLQLRVNQIDECIESAKQALILEPNNVNAYRIMGYAQIQKGETENGKANLQKAIDLGDEAAKEIMQKYVK